MSVADSAAGFVRRAPVEPAEPPPTARRPLWKALTGTLGSTVTTLLIASMFIMIAPALLRWAVLDGVWYGDGDACRAGGACWAFLRAKYGQILFGIYPSAERWRPLLAATLILALSLWSLPRSHWTRRTVLAWVFGTVLCLVLMSGGVFGLTSVPSSSWGGLPITLLLTVFSLGLGFPLAVILALGRRAQMLVPRWLCIAVIEVTRGLPLLSLLFIASILLPLMLPEGMTIDKLLRAVAALTIFSAAYIAEVLRGGLQGVSDGQSEAARALGLSWFETTRRIILPQAIRKVIPPLTSTVVVVVKNTSLVLVIGLFDLLSAGRAAATDPAWPAPYAETYLLIAAIYFVICFGISRYALRLETTMPDGART